ncbi:hypothetical protein D3C87_611170 [compost metagenome]
MVEREHHAQRERAAQAGAEHDGDDGRRHGQREPERRKARQLREQRTDQPAPQVALAAAPRERRQRERADDLRQRHEREHGAALLRRPAALGMEVMRQPRDEAGVAAVDEAEAQRQQPRAAVAEAAQPGAVERGVGGAHG